MFIVVVVLVVLAIAGITVVTSLAPNDTDEEDERDRLIEMRGDQVGGYMLAVGALFALGLAMVEVEYFWIANTLLASLVLSEIGKAALMVIVYRRGYTCERIKRDLGWTARSYGEGIRETLALERA